ncbi:MAG: mechanosensitive ion channel [Gammaproteobacteria bacterium]|nr:mechanosensitive ion channel [Gammaproteobacteria bacterium]
MKINLTEGMVSLGAQTLRQLRSVAAISTIFMLLVASVPVSAQMPVNSDGPSPTIEWPENLTREEVRDLVARMSDDEVRELIINQLDKLAAAAQSSDNDIAEIYIGQFRKGIEVAANSLQRVFTSGGDVYALPISIWQQITDNGNISDGYLLFQLLGLLLVGLAVERLVKHLLRNVGRNLEDVDSTRETIAVVLLKAVLGLVEIGGFVAGAAIFLAVTSNEVEATRILWENSLWYIVYIKIALLVVNLLVSPGKPASRLAPVDDAAARGIWLWTLALVMSLMVPFGSIARDLGFDGSALLLPSLFFSAIFIGLLIALVLRLRRYGTKLIAGPDVEPGSAREGLARVWWVLAIFYILLILFMAIGKRAATGESSLVPGIGSLVLFSFIPYLDIALQKLIARFFAKDEDLEDEDQEQPADAESAEASGFESVVESRSEDDRQIPETIANPVYLVTALRYARVLYSLAILIIFVRLWDINLEFFVAQLVGQRVASAMFEIGLTLVLIWAIWGVVRIAIERKLSDEKGPVDEDEGAGGGGDGGGLGGTRLETVLPIFRIFIKITMIVMAVLLSLSALGVDIGPLIAGAGIVGIAIGFGAQTLVRDIVSGLFFLMDDAFRVGEYVSISEIRGTVERISIRSFQLRHHNGMVHTIPYGEIQSLTNYSRDWAIMKFELRVSFETDIDKVRKIIKNIGIEMLEDPVFGANMLMPLKSQGVNRMDDSALIIRCKFTAIPGQQFLIRREAFTRIQKAFEENGIQFAPRRVLVESVAPAESKAAVATAIAGAAGVMDQELPADGSAKASDR